jgi:hypothetical protein
VRPDPLDRSRSNTGAVLVTGVPRSGTTWLARLLAAGPGTAMPGREPMNPRSRQYALGGTLRGWSRLDPTDGRQARLLRRCYSGREVRTFSRFGVRQWAACLPRTRVVIKDPFALLSLATVTRLTGAVPVLLFRHPGAVLVSYRRRGWRADIDEVVALGAPRPPADDDVTAMGIFWSWCNTVALDDLDALAEPAGYRHRGLVTSHEQLVAGGDSAVSALRLRLGLAQPRRRPSVPAPGRQRRGRGLHDFARDPVELTEAWRDALTPDEVARLDDLTAATAQRLSRAAAASLDPDAGPS